MCQRDPRLHFVAHLGRASARRAATVPARHCHKRAHAAKRRNLGRSCAFCYRTTGEPADSVWQTGATSDEAATRLGPWYGGGASDAVPALQMM